VKTIKKKSLAIFVLPIILTLASMPVAHAEDSALTYRVTYKANASGSFLAQCWSAVGEGIYYAELGSGYITMVGEALAKGPIPYHIPLTDPSSYPTDPKTGTPMYPLGYMSDARELNEFSGIGSIFANWTVNGGKTHKWILYLRPEPESQMLQPFTGVFYPESDSCWIPIHYQGFNESYQEISGEGVFAPVGTGLGHPSMPEDLYGSSIGVGLFIDEKVLSLIWCNKRMNLQSLNPEYPDKELPAAVAFDCRVELETSQFSSSIYAGVVGIGVATMAVIGVALKKWREVNLDHSPA